MEQLKEFPEEGCFYAKAFVPLLVKYLESLGGVPNSAYSLKPESIAGVAWGLDNQKRVYYWYLKGRGSKKPRYTYEQLQPFLTQPEQASFKVGDVFECKKDYYNFKKGFYYSINALGPNNSFCLNDTNFDRWFSILNGFYTFFKPVENQIPATVNQHGLEVGREVTEKQLNDWVALAKNKYSSDKCWSNWSSFIGNRKITGFVKVEGIDCFSISGTVEGVYIKAEGFLDFINKDKFVKKEHEFEVDKWYKVYWSWNKEYYYAKFAKEDSERAVAIWHQWIKISDKFLQSAAAVKLSEIKNPQLIEDLTEIQEYLPLTHPDKSFFEVGKWYYFTTVNSTYKMYVKAGVVDKEKGILCYGNDSYYITNGSYEYGSSIYLKSIENPRLLTDLSEIQEFLPEGHVDKKYQPKVGDWVVITGLDANKLGFENTGNNSSKLSVGDVVQLVEDAEEWCSGGKNSTDYHWWRTSKDKNNGIVSVLFRKAEAHEIPSSDKSIEWKVGDAFEVIKDNPNGSELKVNTTYYIIGFSDSKAAVFTSKTQKKSGDESSSDTRWVCIEHMKKPETVKAVEPWSVGTYVVIVEKKNGIILSTGSVREIQKFSKYAIEVEGDVLALNREKDGTIKWFATKEEAEQFAKTLNTLSNDELLKMAIEKYPVGTIYRAKYKKADTKVKGTLKLHTSRNGTPYITDGWGGAVYEDGEWAEIVSTPKSKQIPGENKMKWDRLVEVGDNLSHTQSTRSNKFMGTVVSIDLKVNRIRVELTVSKAILSYKQEEFYNEYALFEKQIPEVKKADPLYVLGTNLIVQAGDYIRWKESADSSLVYNNTYLIQSIKDGKGNTDTLSKEFDWSNFWITVLQNNYPRQRYGKYFESCENPLGHINPNRCYTIKLDIDEAKSQKFKAKWGMNIHDGVEPVIVDHISHFSDAAQIGAYQKVMDLMKRPLHPSECFKSDSVESILALLDKQFPTKTVTTKEVVSFELKSSKSII